MISVNNLPNALPGEKIVKVIRRTKFVLFFRFLGLVVMTALPLFGFAMFIVRDSAGSLEGLVMGPTVVLGTSAYYLFIWLFFFFLFIDWYLDVWIITTDRIIDINQKGFFSRTVSEQMIFRVQDVTSDVKGIIPTLLDYGHIHVQAASEVERIHLYQISQPAKMRELIMQLVEEHNNKQNNETE